MCDRVMRRTEQHDPTGKGQHGRRTRAAYGGGSMTEREPGVWRLRVMTSRGQVERTFRGGNTAARRAANDLAGEPPNAGATYPFSWSTVALCCDTERSVRAHKGTLGTD
jgi:hypothetical protein